MAHSLADFQREYDKLEELITSGSKQIDTFDTNLTEYGEHMKAGGTELALRLKALAATGVVHATIEPYLADRTVAKYVKEMSDQRELAKYTANQARDLGATFPDLVARGKNLQINLQNEIATRQGKRASKTLRINQSVNQMPALLAKVDKLVNMGNPHFRTVDGYMGLQTAAQFDLAYRELIKEALTTSAKTVKKSDQNSRRLQSLSYKISNGVLIKTRHVYKELQQASKEAVKAATSRNTDALNAAKKKAKLAHLKSKPLTEPYAKALKDVGLMAAVDQWKDWAKARAAITAIANYDVLIKIQLADIIGLKVDR